MPTYTVRDHLSAMGESPEWVICLAEGIEEITHCNAALAASRARDLSSRPQLAQGLEQFVTGWRAIKTCAPEMSPFQRQTLEQIISGMVSQISGILNS